MDAVIVDYRTTDEELESLCALKFEIIKCPRCLSLYNAVDGHPDMQLFVLNSREIIAQKNIGTSFVDFLIKRGYKVHFSLNTLAGTYPQDIILNSLIVGDNFIHRLGSTDPNLLAMLSSYRKINVKQGYTKCSTAVLSEKAAITSDRGIAAALSGCNVDVLLLPPGDIDLPGLNYGFIGGTCGLLEKGVLAFYGELQHYAYGHEVLNFLTKHKITPVYLKRGKLVDRGTLFRI